MPRTFRHQNQLIQLERKDPHAARKAHRLIEVGRINSAIAVIVAAMHRLNERLATLQTSPPALPALTNPPLYDLVICVKKFGYSTTSQADNPIAWLKFAGLEKEKGQGQRVTDPEMQERLEGFELVDTEARQFQIIYKYRKARSQ